MAKLVVSHGGRKKRMATVVANPMLVEDEVAVCASRSKLKVEKWWLTAVTGVGKAWK